MALLHSAIRVAVNALPKMVTPKAHAILDYAVAAAFLLTAVKTWKTDKRAAVPAFIIGGGSLALALMTDYPGGISRRISLPTHLEIDATRAGMIGSLPSIIGFKQGWPALFFRTQGIAIAAIAGLTCADHANGYRARTCAE